ncbi:MAG: MFS transporter [Methylorubrum populi]
MDYPGSLTRLAKAHSGAGMDGRCRKAEITANPARGSMVATVLFLAWIVAYMDRVVMGTAIIPMASEFGLDRDHQGLVLGAFYVSYALMQLGGGWLTDRFGARLTLIGCLAFWSAFTGMTGLAWSLETLLVARLLFGLGEGGFAPASASAIATMFPDRFRGRLQALMGSTVFLGGAMGGATMAWTIARFGWRATFIGLAVVGFAVMIGFIATLPSRPATCRELSSHPPIRWRDVAVARGLWPTALLWFCISFTSLGLQSWMPSYLVATQNIDIVHVGIYSIIPGTLGFLATNLAGRLLDVMGMEASKYLIIGGAGAILFSVVLLLLSPSLSLLLIAWSFYMLAFGCLYASVLSVPVKSLPPAIAGRAMGIINFCGQIAGAIAAVTVGKLMTVAQGDFRMAFSVFVAASLIGLILSLPMARLYKTSIK